jgi:hypothetical protein
MSVHPFAARHQRRNLGSLRMIGFCNLAANVRKAVQDVRRYKRWWADWEAMGNAAPNRGRASSYCAQRQSVFLSG